MSEQYLFEAIDVAKSDSDARRILDSWSEKNTVVAEVLKGITTFEAEANAVIQRKGPKRTTQWYDAQTPREKDLASCLGPFRYVDIWYDLALGTSGAAAIGALLGLAMGHSLASGGAKTDYMRQYTAASAASGMSRRDFMYQTAFKAAASFALFGLGGGFVKNLWDKGSYRQRAKLIDKAVASYRSGTK